MADRAIILVDHGSQVAAANRMLDDLAALVRSMTGDRVYAAHMELAEPTLDQAFAQAAEYGAKRIYVFPYFLAPGRHSTEDIPCLCAAAAAKLPASVSYHCGEPIGLARELAELILRRVEDCPLTAYARSGPAVTAAKPSG